MKFAERIAELLYPSQANCLGCAAPNGAQYGWLCSECTRQLVEIFNYMGERCERCGAPMSSEHRCRVCKSWKENDVDMARFVYAYDSPISGLIHQFKYSRVHKLDVFLGGKICEMVEKEQMPKPDILVPVPLHKSRQRDRGFNQAELLARTMEIELGWSVAEVLERTHKTKQQAKLGAAKRKHNLQGVFSLIGNAEGLSIMLVDDVLTTGSTANECANVLKAGGAACVSLVTVAAAVGVIPLNQYDI